MPAVVIRSSILPVVTQTHVVADLMRGSFGGIRFRICKVVVVNPDGPVAGITQAAEDTQVTYSAASRSGTRNPIRIAVPRDQGMRSPRGHYRRPFCGYIDIKRSVVFGDALPDSFDGEPFR